MARQTYWRVRLGLLYGLRFFEEGSGDEWTGKQVWSRTRQRTDQTNIDLTESRKDEGGGPGLDRQPRSPFLPFVHRPSSLTLRHHRWEAH